MNLAGYIDHTLLKPEARVEDIIKLCEEAEQFKFAAVCVQPIYVDLAAHCLAGTGVKTATVIGFPFGVTFTGSKVAEAKEAVFRKAGELDMVMNIGAAKAGRWEVVTDDIKQVVEIADGVLVKVIIETCLLTEEEKRRACHAVIEAGTQFVKTSTGFGTGGATVADIQLIKRVVGDKIGIKASGGIRTLEQAKELIAAGATRLGTSSGVAIVGGTVPKG
ncbi:deoxyribose-phosphate aldolase [Sporomusa acidovorans]|uniref:Deoxyribose-phosphate aldolase n=1 Tax=Sporomusa acidovorans (strain ATCC 49682 / DSM 3132 / Mol) TaxID=1123286 RepID=A0ABZ3J981_SPOA4|nr:deoxyribose-phosphate aldolase [Sporomusa acidovorans]OZC22939.1 deoxyribose-phosphate aldolase [Sporomusa acidovorans DSM 3132]SDE94644.1 deoxyribose-phosphate aldolase [Sporomusa acidovorans]